MEHPVNTLERVRQAVGVAHVALHHVDRRAEIRRPAARAARAPAAAANRRPGLVPVLQQLVGQMRADETGSPDDQVALPHSPNLNRASRTSGSGWCRRRRSCPGTGTRGSTLRTWRIELGEGFVPVDRIEVAGTLVAEADAQDTRIVVRFDCAYCGGRAIARLDPAADLIVINGGREFCHRRFSPPWVLQTASTLLYRIRSLGSGDARALPSPARISWSKNGHVGCVWEQIPALTSAFVERDATGGAAKRRQSRTGGKPVRFLWAAMREVSPAARAASAWSELAPQRRGGSGQPASRPGAACVHQIDDAVRHLVAADADHAGAEESRGTRIDQDLHKACRLTALARPRHAGHRQACDQRLAAVLRRSPSLAPTLSFGRLEIAGGGDSDICDRELSRSKDTTKRDYVLHDDLDNCCIVFRTFSPPAPELGIPGTCTPYARCLLPTPYVGVVFTYTGDPRWRCRIRRRSQPTRLRP